MTPFEQLLRQFAELAMLAPWRPWARRHPVQLRFSAYTPPATLYVLSVEDPITERVGYTVVVAEIGWRDLRAKMQVPADVPDQDLAEYLAWHQAPLEESSDPADLPWNR